MVGCVYESFVPGKIAVVWGLRQGLPFKVGDNQRPKRTMTGVRKPSPESSVPVGSLTREVGGINCGGRAWESAGAEVPHELSTASYSKECKQSRSNSFPAGFPGSGSTGTEDSEPLTTPDMVVSGRVLQTSVKSLLFNGINTLFFTGSVIFPCFGSLERLLAENFLGNNQSFASLILLCISSVRL